MNRPKYEFKIGAEMSCNFKQVMVYYP